MQKNYFFYLILLLLVIPIPCFAEDESEDSVELLGWVAIVCGMLANIPFIPINRYRKYSIKSGGESLQMARENKIGRAHV